MAFQNPVFRRFMASAAQDQRGTFSDHLRTIFGASPASPEMERDGDIAGGVSIFEEAVRETERDNRMAEARMAEEAVGRYEDHTEFCTHLDAQVELFNYDIFWGTPPWCLRGRVLGEGVKRHPRMSKNGPAGGPQGGASMAPFGRVGECVFSLFVRGASVPRLRR